MIEVNLLPREYRKRATPFHLDRKWMYVGGAVCIVFLILVGLTYQKKHQITELDKKITSVRKQRMALNEDIKLIDGLTELKQKLLTRMNAIEELDGNRGMWVSILEDLASRVPEMMWLTGFAEEAPKEDKSKKRKPRGGINTAQDSLPAKPVEKVTRIEGFAYTLNSIASFIVSMMKSDYLEDVSLAYARQENVGEISAYNFKIECKINRDAWLRENYQPEKTFTSPLADK
jgi:Tfp pilus assembly protein PilN